MLVTVVLDILLDSGIVLLIQDIFSRNGRFVHNGNFSNVAFSFPFFMMSVIFFGTASNRSMHCSSSFMHCWETSLFCLFQCRRPTVFNINHGDCSPHHAGSVADSHECRSERFLYVHELGREAIDNRQVQYRVQSWQQFTICIVNWRSPLGLTACKFRNAYATGACILGKASLSCHEHPKSH